MMLLFHRKESLGYELVLIILGLIFLCPLEACTDTHNNQKNNTESTVEATLNPEDIRLPAVAGSWYSDNPEELRAELAGYFGQVDDNKINDIVGIVSPHAGYTYSGPVAAFAYEKLKGKKYDSVIIIAPSHVEAFPFAAVYGRGAYNTPLGMVRVDTELAKNIAKNNDTVKLSDRGHRQESLSRQEHSLEIQLPFLQMALGEFEMVPIVMGDQSEELVHALAKAIVEATQNKKVLLVASSDLSHFHSQNEAKQIDAQLVHHVSQYDQSNLLIDLENKKVEACGGGPICVVMEAAQKLGATESKTLRYATSGDVPQGDQQRVVGYLAAVFYTNANKGDTQKSNHKEATLLSQEDKRILMQIAKTTVNQVVSGAHVDDFQVASPSLLENRGAFVTLHKGGKLRGCIGYIIGVKPLYQTVREVAEAAALRDPRFPAVTPAELDDLEFEISALSVPRKTTDVEEIKVGVHGIIIKKGYNQGLLLPQVAIEYGWDRITFLEQTCIKAGLPIQAWQDTDTEIQIFSAEVFDEND